MKTTMRIIAVLLCMLIAVPAFADATLVSENVVSSRFVFRTNYLKVSGNNGDYMAAIDGTALTEDVFANMEYQDGYIAAARYDLNAVNCWGLFDMDANIVIPFEYGLMKVQRGGEWAIASVLVEATADQYDYSSSGDNYYLIDYVDIYHLPDMTKMTLKRENYIEAEVVKHCINIKDRTTGVITTYDASFTALGTVDSMYDSDFAPADYVKFNDNGRYGYTDAAGNVIMEPSFAYIDTNDSYTSDYVTISSGDYYGIARRSTGEVIVPPEYDTVRRNSYAPTGINSGYEYDACGYYCVISPDEKVGFVTEGGEVSCEPKYSEGVATLCGASYMVVDLEGNTRIIAADGVETILPAYNSIYALDFCSGVYFKVSDADYNYGVIDWHGNEVLPCKYSTINVSGDGRYILVCEDYSVNYLYELSYPNDGANTAAAEQTAAEQPADAGAQEEAGEATGGSIVGSLSNLFGGGAANETDEEETAVEEIPVEAPDAEDVAVDLSAVEEAPADAPVDNSNAIGLLTSASTLLKSDPAGNSSAVVSLLGTAIGMVANNDDVTSVLTTALNLLVSDPEGNATTVISLIDGALILLK